MSHYQHFVAEPGDMAGHDERDRKLILFRRDSPPSVLLLLLSLGCFRRPRVGTLSSDLSDSHGTMRVEIENRRILSLGL